MSSIDPSSVISSAALSPISIFVFGSSAAPSRPCDLRGSAATQTEHSVSLSSPSFHSVTTEEEDLKHYIANISVEIERLVKLKDVANERLNEKRELLREKELREES